MGEGREEESSTTYGEEESARVVVGLDAVGTVGSRHDCGCVDVLLRRGR